MFELRTDLALEAHEIAKKNKKHILDGVIFEEKMCGNYKTTRVEIISESGSKATGKPIGKYLTVDLGKIWDSGADEIETACNTVAGMIRELAQEYNSVMIVGLGNTLITADALGPLSLSHVIVTRHLKENSPDIFHNLNFFDISAIAPGVLSQTGIESAETVKGITDKVKPSLVIVIDALASMDISRLGRVIQISNTGISPGSGVGNSRAELSQGSLGIPVISIGIPTVVDAYTLALNVTQLSGEEFKELDCNKAAECKNMFVTPKDCDKIISFMAKVIGYAINITFHKGLSFEDMKSILS